MYWIKVITIIIIKYGVPGNNICYWDRNVSLHIFRKVSAITINVYHNILEKTITLLAEIVTGR